MMELGVDYLIEREEEALTGVKNKLYQCESSIKALEKELSTLRADQQRLFRERDYKELLLENLQYLQDVDTRDGEHPIKWSKIHFKYFEDEEMFTTIREIVGMPFMEFTDEITRKNIIKALEDDSSVIHITPQKLDLGFFAENINLPYLEDGGFFAFWIDGVE